jgi:hypothetical protein
MNAEERAAVDFRNAGQAIFDGCDQKMSGQ